MVLPHILSWSGFCVSCTLQSFPCAKSVMNWSNFGGKATGVLGFRCTLSKSVLCSFLFGKGSFQVFFCVVVHYIGCSKSELFCLFLFRRIDGCVDSIHLPSLARGGMLEVLIFQRAVTQVCLAYSMAYCEKHVVWINVTPPPSPTSQWHYLRQQNDGFETPPKHESFPMPHRFVHCIIDSSIWITAQERYGAACLLASYTMRLGTRLFARFWTLLVASRSTQTHYQMLLMCYSIMNTGQVILFLVPVP